MKINTSKKIRKPLSLVHAILLNTFILSHSYTSFASTGGFDDTDEKTLITKTLKSTNNDISSISNLPQEIISLIVSFAKNNSKSLAQSSKGMFFISDGI